MKPCNDRIIIEPIEEKESDTPVFTPNRAMSLAPATVVTVGNNQCVINGNIVKKTDLVPGIKEGSQILYRKMAEERTAADTAYRQVINGKTVLVILITDILTIL